MYSFRHTLMSVVVLCAFNGVVNASDYKIINNGGNTITVDIIFASAFCSDWHNITLDPGQVYKKGHGSCCLKGARIKSGGSFAGGKGSVSLQGCASLSGPAKVDQVIFNQYADGSWYVAAGRS